MPRGTLSISGKQNPLFPLGLVCACFSISLFGTVIKCSKSRGSYIRVRPPLAGHHVTVSTTHIVVKLITFEKYTPRIVHVHKQRMKLFTNQFNRLKTSRIHQNIRPDRLLNLSRLRILFQYTFSAWSKFCIR